jgi:hypothetical protein
MNLAEILTERIAFCDLVATLRSHAPSTEDWIVVNGLESGDQALLMLRPWMAVDPSTPGCIEYGRHLDHHERPGVGLVVLTEGSEIAGEALNLHQAAQDEDRPRLRLYVHRSAPPGGVRICRSAVVAPDGNLPVVRAPEAVKVRIVGHSDQVAPLVLPAKMTLCANALSAGVTIGIGDESQSFGETRTWHYDVQRIDGTPVGHCPITLSAMPGLNQSDRLTLHAPQTHVIRPSSGPHGRRRFVPGRRVHLHVLIDRTTLDRESWPDALSASQQFELNEPQSGLEWNHRWRRQFAAALLATSPELHSLVEFHLYWFADIPRAHRTAHPNLPRAQAAFGACGEVPRELLGDVLGSATFSYVTGIDLFDAVDEGLLAVSAAIGRMAANARTPGDAVVLVVGDSPPPPAEDRADPMWEIVDRSPRTGTRTSQRFRVALESLEAQGVPVGWLFLRDTRGLPLSSQIGLNDVYDRFRTQREDVLRVLRGIPHLDVEHSGDRDAMAEPLSALFARLGTLTSPRVTVMLHRQQRSP